MNRTKIEWTDYTWNPITGCLHGCSYCYARKIARRFKDIFPNGFRPTFHPERLKEPYLVKKPSKIFTCSMGEMFGSWVDPHWVHEVFRVIWNCSGNGTHKAPKHTFQILTKAPNNIESFFPLGYTLPSNVWLGVTVEDQSKVWRIDNLRLRRLNFQGVRFVSFEPLLGPVEVNLENIDWIIIGAQTNPYRPPKPEWVTNLLSEARENGVAVFLKDNLKWPEKIQEFPKVKEEEEEVDRGAY